MQLCHAAFFGKVATSCLWTRWKRYPIVLFQAVAAHAEALSRAKQNWSCWICQSLLWLDFVVLEITTAPCDSTVWFHLPAEKSDTWSYHSGQGVVLYLKAERKTLSGVFLLHVLGLESQPSMCLAVRKALKPNSARQYRLQLLARPGN